MDYRVVLAPRAIHDLRDIILYISPDRPEAAGKLGKALIEKTRMLAVFPESGRCVPEFGNPKIRELILNPYRIVYRIDEASSVIGVARFWHGSRDDINTQDL